jgi:hypothetical protein
MTEFESRVCGIPCIIRVTDWEAYVPAQTSGPPERCYPSEGGEGHWEILDRKGRPAAWLERKLTGDDRERIDAEVFNHMENQNEYDHH